MVSKKTPRKKGKRMINLPSNKSQRKMEKLASKIANKLAYEALGINDAPKEMI